MNLKSYRHWLHPGIGVKRWLLLVILGALAVVVGALALVGRDLVRFLYTAFPSSSGSLFYALATLLVVGGLSTTAYGASRAVRAIAQGLPEGTERRMGQILYERRRLRRGPRVVAVGGGTGLSTLLRGLKEYTANITAIVTVMDDGGSSGRLRREMNMLPPGDIRNCLIALAEDESRIARLFQHRFRNSLALKGHSLGNLVLAGLQEQTGRFDRAVEELSLMLNTRGLVVPATLEDVDLVAEMEDGTIIKGECAIAESPKRIRRMMLSRPRVRAYPAALEAIRQADLIVLGPGSLFTSIIPNLLVEGIAAEIERSPARKLYVANLMTQPGETDGFTASDHLRTLGDYLNLDVLDGVIVNAEPIPPEYLENYRQEGSEPVWDDLGVKVGRTHVIRAHLLDIVELEGKCTVKHSPRKLAKAIFVPEKISSV